jgi:hypothetical protein
MARNEESEIHAMERRAMDRVVLCGGARPALAYWCVDFMLIGSNALQPSGALRQATSTGAAPCVDDP